MTEAYPLRWPPGRARTPGGKRNWSRFDMSPGRAQKEMLREIEMMGGRDVVVSTNLRVRRDGSVYAADLNKQPDDPGVAVYFKRNGRQVCFSCDLFPRVWENMRSIGKTIEAMRGIERWGSAEALDMAFTGFAALPSPDAARPWHEVLGVNPTASPDEVQAAYRLRARQYAQAQNEPALSELNVARDRALREVAP